MAARADDLMFVRIEVKYPDWLDEMDEDEFNNVISSARSKAYNAFLNEINKAERYWRERKKAKIEGQMDIYDYA